eukprot:5101625-Pleurochrysis_carterae.AAC.1
MHVSSAPRRASRHTTPLKLFTRGMWPSLDCAAASRSPFYSLGRLRPFRGGDLEAPGELRRAVAAR